MYNLGATIECEGMPLFRVVHILAVGHDLFTPYMEIPCDVRVLHVIWEAVARICCAYFACDMTNLRMSRIGGKDDVCTSRSIDLFSINQSLTHSVLAFLFLHGVVLVSSAV